MQDKVYYLETGSTDAAYNLAFEQFVLENKKQQRYLMLWQNENTVVVGQNQNAEAEINRRFVDDHKITVVRRMTGGGAVYHDLGNLNYSFITDFVSPEQNSFERFTAPIVQALKNLGLCAKTSGRNDILIDDLKVSGTAQRIHKNRVLFHGTLLFNANRSMISGALNADPLKFKAKAGISSVKSRVGNIKDFLQNDMELLDFWEYLKTTLAGNGFEKSELDESELFEIEKLADAKYRTYEWNFGKSPKYNIQNKNKFDGGIIETIIDVENGAVKDIVFFGDFLSLRALDEIKHAVINTPFDKTEIESVLSRFKLEEYFGTITKQEILQTIFY